MLLLLLEEKFSFFRVSCFVPQTRTVCFYFFISQSNIRDLHYLHWHLYVDIFPLPIKILRELQSMKLIGSYRKCLGNLYTLKHKAK